MPMSRLIVTDRKKDWQTCQICEHLINPEVQVCDEAWRHFPCTHAGCVPRKSDPEVHV